MTFVSTSYGLSKVTWYLILVVIVVIRSCSGHGRLIEPPSRASAWRYGFNTPPDYNDHELYCGGFTRQWKHNSGKCGECGDAWDLPEPRPHEHGGQWGLGVIVRRYTPGAEILIRVELTASHMGFFEFRLCPEPKAKQDCLDHNLLIILGGTPSQHVPGDIETRFYPRNGSRIYEIKTKLPDISCNHCVLQWRYVAGNNWGMCQDGNGAVGCGPQEEFRSCSDIALGDRLLTPIRPVRPSILTTHRPTVDSKSTKSIQQEDYSRTDHYIPLLIVFLVLLLTLFIFVIWYFDRKGNTILAQYKKYLYSHLCVKKCSVVLSSKKTTLSLIVPDSSVKNLFKAEHEHEPSDIPISESIPIPPPRSKRHERLKDPSRDESCSITVVQNLFNYS